MLSQNRSLSTAFAVFVILGSSGALASTATDAVSAAVVKLQSAPCHGGGSERLGSGILLKDQGQVYVLTSSHVPYHGNSADGVCHQGKTSSGAALNLQLVATNVLNGLAMLTVDAVGSAAVAADAIPLAILGSSPPVTMHKVWIEGYPANSTSLVEYSGLSLAQPAQDLFPQTSLLAVRGLSEWGMSGGALLDSTGQLLGILSHQYLTQVGSQAAVLQAYHNDASPFGVMNTLAVPSAAAFAWWKSVQGGGLPAMIPYDLKAQLQGSDEFSVAGLRFAETNCDNAATSDAIGATPCQVVVQADPRATLTWPLANAEAFANLRQLLPADASKAVAFKDGTSVRQPLNLLNALSLLSNPGSTVQLMAIEAWHHAGTLTFAGGQAATQVLKLPQAQQQMAYAITRPIFCLLDQHLTGTQVMILGASPGSTIQQETRQEMVQEVITFGTGGPVWLVGVTLTVQAAAGSSCDYDVWIK